MKLPIILSILFSSFKLILSTEVCYIHRWNIYCVTDAQEGSNKSSQYLLDSAALKPIGLSYGEHCAPECSPYLLFTESDLSDGTLFAIDVNNWREKRPYHKIDLETLMKHDGSTPNPTKLEYDPLDNQVLTLHDGDSVLRSELHEKLQGYSKPPTEVYSKKGALMVDLSLDHCNRLLYLLQHSENKSSVFRLNAQKNSNATDILLESVSDVGMYKALHYDPYSTSIYLAFTDNNNATTFQKISATGSDVLQPIKTVNNSLPYDITSDDEFLYWSDWARGGVMRLRKDAAGDAILVAEHEDEDGYHGAMELTVLLNPLALCPSRTHVVEYDDTEGQYQDYPEGSADRKSGEISIPDDSKDNVESSDQNPASEEKISKIENPKLNVVHSRELSPNNEEVSNSLQSDVVLHNDETEEDSVENRVSAPTKEKISDVQDERTIILWSKPWTSHQVLGLFSALVCVVILLSCLLTISVFTYYSHICRKKSAVVKYSKYSGLQEQGPSDYSLKNDVVVNHEAEGSLPSKSIKKKVFRASKDKFSRLKPKPSNCDGVSINIEDCCQMTLCETPCYTSVTKQGRDYLDTCDSSDKSSLLSNCHTSC